MAAFVQQWKSVLFLVWLMPRCGEAFASLHWPHQRVPSLEVLENNNGSPLQQQQRRITTTTRRFMDLTPEDYEFEGDEQEEEEEEEELLSDEELLATAGEWEPNIAPFNTVHLSGRVGQTPQARYFEDGKVVVNLSLAVKRKYHFVERAATNIRSGEEETDWFGLEIWGQQAEFVAKYVDKGARVGVVGTLEIDEWNDRETGQPRSRAKVIVQDLDILETRAESELRRSRSSSSSSGYGSNNNNYSRGGGGGGGGSGYYEEGDGASSAGTGGFFG